MEQTPGCQHHQLHLVCGGPFNNFSHPQHANNGVLLPSIAVVSRRTEKKHGGMACENACCTWSAFRHLSNDWEHGREVVPDEVRRNQPPRAPPRLSFLVEHRVVHPELTSGPLALVLKKRERRPYHHKRSKGQRTWSCRLSCSIERSKRERPNPPRTQRMKTNCSNRA